MLELVRVGVIGTSWYTDAMHLPLLKNHEQVRIVAICGRKQDRAHDLADKYGIPLVYADYHKLMTRDLVDAVVIAVPDDLHHPVTMAALDAHLHVLDEGPMAYSLDEACEMLDRAEAARVTHMLYFSWRWIPYMRTLQKLVEEGFIGDLYDARFEFYGGYAREGQYQWKWDRSRGLGALGDLGSHMIDLAHLLCGPITHVQAHLNTRVEKPHPEGLDYKPANDTAYVNIQFASGGAGSIFASAAVDVGSRGQVQRMQLVGSAGTLEMEADMLDYRVRGIRKGEPHFKTIPIPGEFLPQSKNHASPSEQMWQVFSQQSIGTRLFIDSIIQDTPLQPNFRDGVKAQAVMDAAIRADASGRWESVPQDLF